MFGQLVPGIVPLANVSIRSQSPPKASQDSPTGTPSVVKDHTFYTIIENEIGKFFSARTEARSLELDTRRCRCSNLCPFAVNVFNVNKTESSLGIT